MSSMAVEKESEYVPGLSHEAPAPFVPTHVAPLGNDTKPEPPVWL